jgi:transcriptional regulator
MRKGGFLHPASVFRETDCGVLGARVAERGFAVVVGLADGRPLIAHAPVLLDGEHLRFHLSAANPLAVALAVSSWALAVITGEDAYISPDWYAGPDQVPTWNYLSVEIEGPVRVLPAAEAAELLDDLSARYEARLAPKPPWTRAKMTAGRFAAMLAGIVAFEMTVERLIGVTKLSQNKSADEVARVAGQLSEARDEGARRIAWRMVNLPGEDRS